MHKRNKKLKILHLIEGLGSGGAERLLYTNLKYFDRDVLESEVITIFSGANYWKKPILELGIPVASLECESVRDIFKGVARLRSRLHQAKPDLIHTHLWSANVVGRIAGRMENIPVVSSVHNPEYEPEVYGDNPQINAAKLHTARLLDKWSAKFGCRKMLAVSSYVEECTVRRLCFPPERIEVIYNAIDTFELFSGAVRAREDILKELDLPANTLLLLNVARVSPQKGLLYTIQALEKIKRSFPEAHLISIGGKDDALWLQKIEAECDRLRLKNGVHLLGSRRDVRDFLHNCDVFIFPSLFEGFGIALTEAMAAGCACVVSDIKPINEFIEHHENGILVPSRNSEALAASVSELLADAGRRRTLGEAARKTALNLFQPQPAVEKLVNFYESVL